MNIEDIEMVIRRIIQNAIDTPTLAKGFGRHEDLFTYGLNSVSFIKIIVGIENEYDFEFEDIILVGEGFNTLNCFIEYTMVRTLGAL